MMAMAMMQGGARSLGGKSRRRDANVHNPAMDNRDVLSSTSQIVIMGLQNDLKLPSTTSIILNPGRRPLSQ